MPFDIYCVQKHKNPRDKEHNAHGPQRNIDNWAYCPFLKSLYGGKNFFFILSPYWVVQRTPYLPKADMSVLELSGFCCNNSNNHKHFILSLRNGGRGKKLQVQLDRPPHFGSNSKKQYRYNSKGEERNNNFKLSNTHNCMLCNPNIVDMLIK